MQKQQQNFIAFNPRKLKKRNEKLVDILLTKCYQKLDPARTFDFVNREERLIGEHKQKKVDEGNAV